MRRRWHPRWRASRHRRAQADLQPRARAPGRGPALAHRPRLPRRRAARPAHARYFRLSSRRATALPPRGPRADDRGAGRRCRGGRRPGAVPAPDPPPPPRPSAGRAFPPRRRSDARRGDQDTHHDGVPPGSAALRPAAGARRARHPAGPARDRSRPERLEHRAPQRVRLVRARPARDVSADRPGQGRHGAVLDRGHVAGAGARDRPAARANREGPDGPPRDNAAPAKPALGRTRSERL